MKTNLQGQRRRALFLSPRTTDAASPAFLFSVAIVKKKTLLTYFTTRIKSSSLWLTRSHTWQRQPWDCRITPTPSASHQHTLFCFFFSLTSMAGVARVVAVVAGDPQDPVLDVVHPVGRHFGVAVRERSAAAAGRRRLARQVRVLQGLQSDARLVSTLQNTLGAYHRRSERTGKRSERGWAPITMRETLRGAAATISNKARTSGATFTFLQWCSRTQSKVIKLQEPGGHETLGGVSLLSHGSDSIRWRRRAVVSSEGAEETTVITAFTKQKSSWHFIFSLPLDIQEK